VSVVDTRPPVIVVPANVAAAPTGPAGGTTITSTGTVAAGWPKQTQVSCSTFTGMEDDVSGATTGATTLRYDEVGGQFVYNWQTPRSAGTCWRLEVMLVDGTAHDLLVKLK
jgi:hypothetical protein